MKEHVSNSKWLRTMISKTVAMLTACMLLAGMTVGTYAESLSSGSEYSVETTENTLTASGAPEGGEIPGGPGNGGEMPGGPGGGSSSNVSWTGATEITASTTQTGKTYTSTTADQNALLINASSGSTVNINDATVSKSGGTSASDNYSFYGINSGIMVKGGVTANISGATINTDAEGANGVFSYGANNGSTNATGDGTTVNISDSTITTTGNGSGGIMTTYGGTTNATNLTVTTSGGSSAPIRTDRGGGWVTVKGGTYTSGGQGSPAIYSTADVNVTGAKLVSKKSEGAVIEGTGSITLTNTDLTASNTTLNGNARFYDTVMIYQSMSGDADSGQSSFTMTGGSITSNNGHTFHITNTNALIALSGVDIKNSSDNVLLSVCDDGWSGGSNKATLKATDQTLSGDVLVGSNSSLTMTLSGASVFTGSTSGKITDAKGSTVSTTIGTLDMTIDSGSVWMLTGDSYVTSISGSGSVNYNGHTLYVNGTAYTAENPYSGISCTTETEVSGGTDTEETTGGSNQNDTEETAGDSNQNESTILKANTLKASGNKVTVKYSKLKKGKVKIAASKAYKISKAEGTVSYEKVKGNSKIKVNSKTGKITVSKGLKKGTYRIKVKVKAAGNSGYKAGSKTVTVKIVVK